MVATVAQNEIVKVWAKAIYDESPDTSYLEQEGWEDRLAEYERDLFSFVGITVEAEVTIAGVPQILDTPGLWGIESDSGNAYFEEVANEQFNEYLAPILEQLGYTEEEIIAARTDADMIPV